MAAVKICGIRTKKSAMVALKAGVDFLGFNFVKQSKRYIKPDQAKKIITGLKGKIKTVGVFQNHSLRQVNKLVSLLNLDFVQLHGKETNEFCQQVKTKVIKAFCLPADFAVAKAEKLIKSYQVDFYLLDREKRAKGELLNFLKVKKIAQKFPVFLAGGLNLENIEEAIIKAKPYAVDVCSGIETKNKADLEKIRIFIKKVKESSGHFGKYGGRYAPEMLIPALEELEESYKSLKNDLSFQNELNDLYQNYAGRPTPLYFAQNLTKKLGGAKIYLKNEGLLHTGAHKMNNCLGQALLAKRMAKKRLIAETGAGQHGLATATVAAKFGFKCTIYMGEIDIKRQRPNVFWMEQLGARVIPVCFGTKTLKDAVNASLKDWITNVKNTYYLLGSTLGPHPYPMIVRDFQSIIGKEVKKQILKKEGRLPDYLIACVGGGSNALGLFYPFLKYKQVKMIGVEAGGKGVRKPTLHAARFQGGKLGVVEGYKSFFLQDKDGNILPTHSISAGLDYAGIGPEMAYLKEKKRVSFTYATDKEALNAFKTLAKKEGVIPALESAHAVAEAIKLAPRLQKDKIIVVNLSGRGDKDIFIVAKALADKSWKEFLKTQL